IVETCRDLDVVVSTDEDAGTPAVTDTPTPTITDTQGFRGRTLVLYTTQSSYGLNGVTLGLDAANRIARADLFATWLGDSVPDQRAVRDALTRFYDAIGRTQAAQASVPPLFAADPARLTGDYAGAARCQPCHAAEHAQWKDTAH